MSDDAIQRLRRENPFPETLPAPAIEPVLGRLSGLAQPSRSRTHPAFGRVGVAAGVGAAVVVAVLALVLVGHGHGPAPIASHSGPPAPTGPPNPGTPAAYLNAAYQATVKRDPTCFFTHPIRGGTTRVSDGAPSRALLAAFSVLRRPATAADRLTMSRFTNPSLRIVYARYIRRARVVNGVSYYLIPGQVAPPPSAAPPRCFSEQHAALQSLVAHLPPGKRAAIMRAGTQMLSHARRAGLGLPNWPYPGIDLEGLGRGGGGTCCVRASRAPDQLSMLISGTIASGVVPDSVASVSLYYTKISSQNVSTIIAKATRVVTAPVIDNVYVVDLGSKGRPEPSAVVYRSATGAALRSFDTNK